MVQLLLLVLNKVDKLDELYEMLIEQGYSGATILTSVGMVGEISKNIEHLPIFGSLNFLTDKDQTESKTIFMVLKDQEVETVKKIIRQVIGDLSQPDTGILFTLPVLSAEGIGF